LEQDYILKKEYRIMSEKKCPNCNGGGVIQEYDEFDRYYTRECSRCGGSGVINFNEILPCPSYKKETLKEAVAAVFEELYKSTASDAKPIGIIASIQNPCPICTGHVQGFTIEDSEIRTHQASFCWNCGRKVKASINEVTFICSDCGCQEIVSKRKSVSMDGKRCPECQGPLFLRENKEG